MVAWYRGTHYVNQKVLQKKNVIACSRLVLLLRVTTPSTLPYRIHTYIHVVAFAPETRTHAARRIGKNGRPCVSTASSTQETSYYTQKKRRKNKGVALRFSLFTSKRNENDVAATTHSLTQSLYPTIVLTTPAPHKIKPLLLLYTGTSTRYHLKSATRKHATKCNKLLSSGAAIVTWQCTPNQRCETNHPYTPHNPRATRRSETTIIMIYIEKSPPPPARRSPLFTVDTAVRELAANFVR